MPCRLAGAVLLVVMSPAVVGADEPVVTLSPSCARIDTTRDALAADLRERSRRLLVRILEREELLVVDAGCVDTWAVSHEHIGDGLLVRISGPRGARRARGASLDDLPRLYARMVHSLLEPPQSRAEPEPGDQEPASEPDSESSEYRGPSSFSFDAVPPDEIEVTPDRLIYVQTGVGSHGYGYALGYRRQTSSKLAMDLSVSGSAGDTKEQRAVGVEVLYVPQPRRPLTPYFGGGLSIGTQNDGNMTGAGTRAELTAGFAFARRGATRWFAQADVAVPFYTQQAFDGAKSYSPTASASLGIGF